MTAEDVQLFLEGEQGICGLTISDCEELILKYERSEEAKTNKQLLIDGFSQFLLAQEADLEGLLEEHIVCQDMSQPFCHYFIAASHNTYVRLAKRLWKCRGHTLELLRRAGPFSRSRLSCSLQSGRLSLPLRACP